MGSASTRCPTALRSSPAATARPTAASCTACPRRSYRGLSIFRPASTSPTGAPGARRTASRPSSTSPAIPWAQLGRHHVRSARRPDLARAMEEAFAADTPPVGLGAITHAAALAWTLPGFAAFDAGGTTQARRHRQRRWRSEPARKANPTRPPRTERKGLTGSGQPVDHRCHRRDERGTHRRRRTPRPSCRPRVAPQATSLGTSRWRSRSSCAASSDRPLGR